MPGVFPPAERRSHRRVLAPPLGRSVRGSLSLAGKRKRLALLDNSSIPSGTISTLNSKERCLT